MPRTPKRAGRAPREGHQFASEFVAANVRRLRAMRRLSQEGLAHRMQRFGHNTWSRVAVGEIENGSRSVTVDELVALAAVFYVSVPEILDPLGPALPGLLRGLDFGGPKPVPAVVASHWLHGRIALGLTPDGEGIDWETADARDSETRREVRDAFTEQGWTDTPQEEGNDHA